MRVVERLEQKLGKRVGDQIGPAGPDDDSLARERSGRIWLQGSQTFFAKRPAVDRHDRLLGSTTRRLGGRQDHDRR
jgi:hypothetical protein